MNTSERRIKRRIHARPQSCVVRCPTGFSDVTMSEVEALLERLSHAQKTPPRARAFGGGVLVEGLDFRNLLQLPYELTTARDVLWRVHAARAANPSQLRHELASVDWEDLLPRAARFGVRVSSTRSRVYHEGLIEDETVLAAEKSGAISVRKLDAEHMVEVRLDRDMLEVFVSLSGPRLYMRGFKSALRGVATIKEDLAAICVQLALRHAQTSWALSDFMPDAILAPYAGTGTLGFEALIALHRVPLWAFPRSFSQESLPCIPQASLGFIRKRQSELARTGAAIALHFVELEAKVCADLAKDVAHFSDAVTRAVALTPPISIAQGDALDAIAALAADDADKAPATLVLMNPPYGRRLGELAETRQHYRAITQALLRARQHGARVCGVLLVPTVELARECVAGLLGYGSELREMRHGGLKIWALSFASTP